MKLFLNSIINEKFFMCLIVIILFDTIFGILRAFKEKNINSTIGIDGLIRKVGMIISIIFLYLIDYLLNVDFINFIPENIKEIININKIGIANLFNILFIIFEMLSVFKNMIKCKLPIPKKLKKYLEDIMKKYTSEIKENGKHERN